MPEASVITPDQNSNRTSFHFKPVPPKKSNEVVIASINVRTLANDIKLGTSYELFAALRHSVCCMQETRRTGSGVLQNNNTQFIWSGYKKKREGGVGIMIAENVQLVDINTVSPRILQIMIKINNIKMAITNCYSPTNEAKDSTKDTFHDLLSKCIKNTPPAYKQIICGDLNATIGNESYNSWRCLGPTNNSLPTNDNGTRLLNLAENHQLRLENTIRPSTKGEHHINTWQSPKGFEKRLDYFLTSKFIQRHVTKCIVRRGSSQMFDTDHFLIETTLHLPSISQLKKQAKRSTKPSIDISKLNTPDNQKQYIELLQEACLPEPPNDIETLNNTIIESVNQASSTTCQLEVKVNKKHPWENDELRLLTSQLAQCKNAEEIKQLRKSINKKRNILMNQYLKERADTINHASQSRQIEREFSEAKKGMHSKSRKLLVSKESLHNHFEKHFQENTVETPEEIIHPENSCINSSLNNAIHVDESPPTQKEIEHQLSKLKNRKCQGVDKVYMEQLKYGRNSTRFLLYLTTLFFLIWTNITVPLVWLQSRLSCIYKSGSRSDPSNYRGISVSAIVSRLLPMIIIDRISDAYNNTIEQNQYGFRRNKGTDNATFILRNIINTTKEKLYICFIDLTAAYDKIPRSLLFRVLDIRLGCTHLISLLKSIYSETTATITGSQKSFTTKAGCRQGGIESPILFNIYFDTVCRVLDSELRAKLGGDYGIEFQYSIPNEATSRAQRSTHPACGKSQLLRALYADDMFVIFRTKEALQAGMEIAEAVLTRYGLTLSRKKTETMVVNGDLEETTSESIIKLGDKNIKNVSVFKYLGVKISPKNDKVMIQHRIESASAKFAELKDMFKNHRINTKVRARFMNAFVRSRLAYNVHTLFNASSIIQQLEIEWTRLLRRIVKCGSARINAPPRDATEQEKTEGNWDYRYKYTNKQIHKICGTRPIAHFIKIQQLKWIAHVVRMENNSLEKQSLFMKNLKIEWRSLEEESGMDRSQMLRMMMDRQLFNGWLEKFNQQLERGTR